MKTHIPLKTMRALSRFRTAALRLSVAWPDESKFVVEGYPKYLPSFDEFAAAVYDIRIRPKTERELASDKKALDDFTAKNGGAS